MFCPWVVFCSRFHEETVILEMPGLPTAPTNLVGIKGSSCRHSQSQKRYHKLQTQTGQLVMGPWL